MAPIILACFGAWLAGLREQQQLVSATKLRDQAGARLSVRGGQVVEGPFMEAKEAVGGVVVMEAESLEAALAIARQAPTLTRCQGMDHQWRFRTSTPRGRASLSSAQPAVAAALAPAARISHSPPSMKYQGRKKLVLARQTVRSLTGEQLGAAHGGIRASVVSDCFPCPAPVPPIVSGGGWTCIRWICFSLELTPCCIIPPGD